MLTYNIFGILLSVVSAVLIADNLRIITLHQDVFCWEVACDYTDTKNLFEQCYRPICHWQLEPVLQRLLIALKNSFHLSDHSMAAPTSRY